MTDKKFLQSCVFLITFSLPAILLINFLSANGYPILTTEVLLLLGAFGVLSLAFLGLSFLSRRLAILIVATFLVAYLGEILPLLENLPKALQILPFKLFLISAFIFLIFVALNKFNRSSWGYLTAGIFVTLMGTLITGGLSGRPFDKIIVDKPASSHRNDLPPILFLVLDEHMSIKWAPTHIPLAQTANLRMKEFYKKFDFLLFTNAYSHYFNTTRSLTNLLNLTSQPDSVHLRKKGKQKDLLASKVFDILGEKGYRFRVYQSEYLNFCEPISEEQLEFCYSYNVGVPGIKDENLAVTDKSLVIFGNFLSAIKIGPTVDRKMGDILATIAKDHMNKIPILGAPYNHIGPLRTKSAMNRLRSDTVNLTNGVVYFAHLLTPHYPFVYDQDNKVKKNPRDWLGPKRWSKYAQITYDQEYENYYGQVLGLYKWMDGWFTELSQNEKFAELIVVVLGDHGSRVTIKDPTKLEVLQHPQWDRIAKDSFSTLFAIKDPAYQSAEIDVLKPLEQILQEYLFTPQNLTVDTTENDFVILKLKDGKFIKVRYAPLNP